MYFASRHARYFTVGRVGEDQIASYARRKGSSVEAVERWLAPQLSFWMWYTIGFGALFGIVAAAIARRRGTAAG